MSLFVDVYYNYEISDITKKMQPLLETAEKAENNKALKSLPLLLREIESAHRLEAAPQIIEDQARRIAEISESIIKIVLESVLFGSVPVLDLIEHQHLIRTNEINSLNMRKRVASVAAKVGPLAASVKKIRRRCSTIFSQPK